MVAISLATIPYKWFLTRSLGAPPNPAPSNPDCDPLTSACFYSAHGCDNAHPVTSCPGGSGPQQKVGTKGDGTFAVQNTTWVQQLFAMGYGGCTWQYGDGVGDQACAWGTQITVTLCPARGIPYQANQLWTFASPHGDCRTDGSTGTPDNITTYGSLFACQTAHMHYTWVRGTSPPPPDPVTSLPAPSSSRSTSRNVTVASRRSTAPTRVALPLRRTLPLASPLPTFSALPLFEYTNRGI